MSYALKTIDQLPPLYVSPSLAGSEKIVADNGMAAGHVTTAQIAKLAIDVSAPRSHTHAISDVTELSAALDAKADATAIAAVNIAINAKADFVAAQIFLGRWGTVSNVPSTPSGQAVLFAVANNMGGSDLYFRTGPAGGGTGFAVKIATSPLVFA